MATTSTAAGRALLPSAGVVVTTVSGAKRLGSGARGLSPWDSIRLEAPGRTPIEITATPCRHGPPLSRPLAGDVIGLALRREGQEHGVLWISGDTVLYDGLHQVADRMRIGTAILHLGGVQFPITGPIRYSMTAQDAVELCRAIRPSTVIPIHYEGWKHFQQSRDEIEHDLANAPADIRWLPLGVGGGDRRVSRVDQSDARAAVGRARPAQRWTRPTRTVRGATSC
jgi:L-ascorbate metabolism protein UlaG (beta-lactamase superfamily)